MHTDQFYADVLLLPLNTATDMFSSAIADELQQLERGVKVYHASLKQDVLLVAPVLLVMCDNPRASEVLCHLGSSANKFCRMCLVCYNSINWGMHVQSTGEFIKCNVFLYLLICRLIGAQLQ